MMVGAGISFPHLYAHAVSSVLQNAGAAVVLIGVLILLIDTTLLPLQLRNCMPTHL